MIDLSTFQRTRDRGSVHDVPELPENFTEAFESYIVPSGEVRQHAVIGGDGPPLLLLGGWPQNWYAWRHLMLPLARSFTVIAVDPRGVGLSDNPREGYDSLSLAADMFALMDASGSPSELSEELARIRMRDAGVVLTATNTLMSEIAQDWSTPNGQQLIGLLYSDVFPAMGAGMGA